MNRKPTREELLKAAKDFELLSIKCREASRGTSESIEDLFRGFEDVMNDLTGKKVKP